MRVLCGVGHQRASAWFHQRGNRDTGVGRHSRAKSLQFFNDAKARPDLPDRGTRCDEKLNSLRNACSSHQFSQLAQLIQTAMRTTERHDIDTIIACRRCALWSRSGASSLRRAGRRESECASRSASPLRGDLRALRLLRHRVPSRHSRYRRAHCGARLVSRFTDSIDAVGNCPLRREILLHSAGAPFRSG